MTEVLIWGEHGKFSFRNITLVIFLSETISKGYIDFLNVYFRIYMYLNVNTFDLHNA